MGAETSCQRDPACCRRDDVGGDVIVSHPTANAGMSFGGEDPRCDVTTEKPEAAISDADATTGTPSIVAFKLGEDPVIADSAEASLDNFFKEAGVGTNGPVTRAHIETFCADEGRRRAVARSLDVTEAQVKGLLVFIHETFMKEAGLHQFNQYNGFISAGGDLAVKTMTVKAAKEHASTLEGCKGFCFNTAMTDQEVEVHFKDQFATQVGWSTWTSFEISRDPPPNEFVQRVRGQAVQGALAALAANAELLKGGEQSAAAADSLSLTFRDPTGAKIYSVTFKTKPLGMDFDAFVKPVKISKVFCAAKDVGVLEGSELVSVAGTNVEQMEFVKILELLRKHVAPLRPDGLVIELRDPSGQLKTAVFPTQPLGMDLDESQKPIRIKLVIPGAAHSLCVPNNSAIVSIGGTNVEQMEYAEMLELLRGMTTPLPMKE